jgi:hypothetical protein
LSTDQELMDEPRADDLSDDLARKYDPERLLKIVSRRAGRGDPLEHSIRRKYEQKFGVDLGHVRVITGEFAEEFNKQRNAYAVTIGSTGMILMGGSGERMAHTTAGQALLAHELTHVAQARRGLSFDKPFATGGGEHEAEAEKVEAEVHSQAAAKPPGRVPGPQDIREAVDQAIEKVKARVMEMLTDVARLQGHRNGSSRRA